MKSDLVWQKSDINIGAQASIAFFSHDITKAVEQQLDKTTGSLVEPTCLSSISSFQWINHKPSGRISAEIFAFFSSCDLESQTASLKPGVKL